MAKKKMNPLSYDLGNAKTVSEDLIREAIISYKELLRAVGAPESLAKGIGHYLVELAEWCDAKKLPPINALAVNGDLHRPGHGYYIAPVETGTKK